MDWEKMNFRTEKEGKGRLSSSRCLTRAGAGDYFSSHTLIIIDIIIIIIIPIFIYIII